MHVQKASKRHVLDILQRSIKYTAGCSDINPCMHVLGTKEQSFGVEVFELPPRNDACCNIGARAFE